jgi:hypothetical protein
MTTRFDLNLIGDPGVGLDGRNGIDVELWSITHHLSGRRIKMGDGFYEEGQDRLRLRSSLAPDFQTLVVNGMTGRNALRTDRVRERLIAAGQPLRLRLTTDLVEFTAKNGPKRGQFISYRVARFR